VSFIGFGRKGLGQGMFGRKGLGVAQPEPRSPGRIFGDRRIDHGAPPFERFASLTEDMARGTANARPSGQAYEALKTLSPEEKGELLADLVGRPGIYNGFMNEKAPREALAWQVHSVIWTHEIAVEKEHLGALLRLLLDHKSLRERSYGEAQWNALTKLIPSAIKQGAFLSSGDCEALAKMASDIRNGHKSYSKADIKKMLARAEWLEKLAGVEVSATEFLMQRCEGADNPWAIAEKDRPHAQFWADLFAEVTIALDAIRADTKGNTKPAWMRSPQAFAAVWPACGGVAPCFGAWDAASKPLTALSQHNGKRTGFADPAAYRRLPQTIALAQAHSRYNWTSNQIPALAVLADLENPAWTALVEHLITQRRATKATSAWAKQALALCKPIGLAVVEARLHDWLALFHTPALDMAAFTQVCNGERFASAIDRLEQAHPDWPAQHAGDIAALGRAIAIKVASGDAKDICGAFHAQLIRLDDHVYKNTRVTEGVLGLPKAHYARLEGHSSYYALSGAMRASVENEEFLRGAVWLVALMPDRARAIDALANVAQTAATYIWTGSDGMRSKIVANAAIATLIAMGGNDIDRVILHLSKVIDNCTINPPLFKYLNRAG